MKCRLWEGRAQHNFPKGLFHLMIERNASGFREKA